MKGQASGQGIGRHSKEEVIEMGMKDLAAISAYLGDDMQIRNSRVLIQLQL